MEEMSNAEKIERIVFLGAYLEDIMKGVQARIEEYKADLHKALNGKNSDMDYIVNLNGVLVNEVNYIIQRFCVAHNLANQLKTDKGVSLDKKVCDVIYQSSKLAITALDIKRELESNILNLKGSLQV